MTIQSLSARDIIRVGEYPADVLLRDDLADYMSAHPGITLDEIAEIDGIDDIATLESLAPTFSADQLDYHHSAGHSPMHCIVCHCLAFNQPYASMQAAIDAIKPAMIHFG